MRPEERRILDDIARHLDGRTEHMSSQETETGAKLEQIRQRLEKDKEEGRVIEVPGPDPLADEFNAMRWCWEILSSLPDDVRDRVLDWLKFKVVHSITRPDKAKMEYDQCPHL